MAGMIIELRRKANGRRGETYTSDLRVFRAMPKTKGASPSLRVRIADSVLTQCGWSRGDFVTIDYDVVDGVFSMRPADEKSGNKLSSGNKKPLAAAQVRFVVEMSHLVLFGLKEETGYDCSVVSAKPDLLTFKRS